MGKGSSYWHSDHREYYSRFPAHNTVVVDEETHFNANVEEGNANHPELLFFEKNDSSAFND